MKFVRKFKTVEEAANFRRRVSNNQTHKTFNVDGQTVVLVPMDTDLMNGWAKIEVPKCDVMPEFGKELFCRDGIPFYGMWF